MSGRPPEGPRLADKLDAPDDDRRRLRVILETIAEKRTVGNACEELGIKPARFYELRAQALQGAVEAIAPGSAGRPREDADPRIAELEAQLRDRDATIRDQDIEIRASQVREQIALTMPHLIKPEPEPLKKKKPSKVLDRLRKDRHRRHRHP